MPDKSRQMYLHPRCGTLPCTCVYTHQHLTFQLLRCYAPGCQQAFYTMGDLQEHHLLRHEKPLNVSARVALLAVTANGIAPGEGTP